MKKYFLLFRDGRRLRAAHVELPKENAFLIVKGRRFAAAGSFGQWSHITDSKKRLVGFVVDLLEDASTTLGWEEWWNTLGNRYVGFFGEAHLFLAEPLAEEWHSDWHHDCAFHVGGSIFADGSGDFVLLIPDNNGCCFRPNEPTVFWSEIGFHLAELHIDT